MFIVYGLLDIYDWCERQARGFTHEWHSPLTAPVLSECSMMIPGTYKEMHNDYD